MNFLRSQRPLPISVLVCALVCIALLSTSAAQSIAGADFVFHNAKITTMDDKNPTASALAIRGQTIVAIGTMEDMKDLTGSPSKLVDLQGRTIIPGINETHIHVRDLGFQQNIAVNLELARTTIDVQQLLKDRLAELMGKDKLGSWRYPTTGEEGPWLFGLGWTQDRLVEKRMANRHELDQVSRDVPISLERIYNGIAVNSKVFELLGIDFDDPGTYPEWFTRDPPDFGAGEIIFRDPDTGLPNGVFVGAKAPRLVSAAVPVKTFQQQVESLVGGLHYLASLGITSVIEAGSSMGRTTRVYQTAYDTGRLPIRAVVYDGWYRSGDPEGVGDTLAVRKRLEALGVHNIGDDRFRIRGAKSSADGGIGSRSAAISLPFLPIPEDPLGDKNFGILREPDFNYLLAQYRLLADYGWEIHTHACGDVAMRRTMDAYKILMDHIKKTNPEARLRWSIIHAYLPDEPGTSVIRDMADYGVIAAINPANLYFEGDSFLRNIGAERMGRHTPYRTFLDAGIVMASGSDYPNNSPDPWIGIYQMVTRKHQISGEAHGAEQRISLLDALKTFTINGAYLTYDDDIRGSLEVGKLADLVILDADLLSVNEEQLLEMSSKVLVTMVDGRVVYQKPGFTLEEVTRK